MGKKGNGEEENEGEDGLVKSGGGLVGVGESGEWDREEGKGRGLVGVRGRGNLVIL